MPRVHCDYTHEGAPRRLRQQGKGDLLPFQEAGPDRGRGRCSRSGPVRVHQRAEKYRLKNAVARSPLAVCDEASVDPDEKFKYELRFPDRTGETSRATREKHGGTGTPECPTTSAWSSSAFDKRKIDAGSRSTRPSTTRARPRPPPPAINEVADHRVLRRRVTFARSALAGKDTSNDFWIRIAGQHILGHSFLLAMGLRRCSLWHCFPAPWGCGNGPGAGRPRRQGPPARRLYLRRTEEARLLRHDALEQRGARPALAPARRPNAVAAGGQHVHHL